MAATLPDRHDRTAVPDHSRSSGGAVIQPAVTARHDRPTPEADAGRPVPGQRGRSAGSAGRGPRSRCRCRRGAGATGVGPDWRAAPAADRAGTPGAVGRAGSPPRTRPGPVADPHGDRSPPYTTSEFHPDPARRMTFYLAPANRSTLAGRRSHSSWPRPRWPGTGVAAMPSRPRWAPRWPAATACRGSPEVTGNAEEEPVGVGDRFDAGVGEALGGQDLVDLQRGRDAAAHAYRRVVGDQQLRGRRDGRPPRARPPRRGRPARRPGGT
jgi:hypothetical protein